MPNLKASRTCLRRRRFSATAKFSSRLRRDGQDHRYAGAYEPHAAHPDAAKILYKVMADNKLDALVYVYSDDPAESLFLASRQAATYNAGTEPRLLKAGTELSDPNFLPGEQILKTDLDLYRGAGGSWAVNLSPVSGFPAIVVPAGVYQRSLRPRARCQGSQRQHVGGTEAGPAPGGDGISRPAVRRSDAVRDRFGLRSRHQTSARAERLRTSKGRAVSASAVVSGQCQLSVRTIRG